MVLKGHTNSVHQLCWDPTHPEYLATASADKTVRIWDTRSAFPHLLRLAATAERALTCTRACAGAKSTHTLKTSGANLNIAWSPDGGHIAVGNKVDLLTRLLDDKEKAVRVD